MSSLVDIFESEAAFIVSGSCGLREKGLRQKAWNRFKELGFPLKQDPGFGYVPFQKLEQTSFCPLEEDDREKVSTHTQMDFGHEGKLVFIDGIFSEEKSIIPPSAIFLPFGRGCDRFGSFLIPHVEKRIHKQASKMSLALRAISRGYYVLYLPPQFSGTFSCIHITEGKETPMASTALQVIVGKEANVTWYTQTIERKERKGNYMSSFLIDLVLQEGALFRDYQLFSGSNHSVRIESAEIALAEEAHYRSTLVGRAGLLLISEKRVYMQGKRSQADLEALLCLSESEQSHLHFRIDHEQEECRSNQRVKHLLYDRSRASFEGKIYVYPEGQKTASYQLAESILLSDDAAVYVKPNLEIFADDVKASHGATIGQIDQAHISYLRSRGLSVEEARKLLLSGFYLDLLETIPSESFRSEGILMMDKDQARRVL